MGDNFDINFKLLPPDLQMKLWVLGLDANTGKVAIAYQNGGFLTSLAYNYGGNVEASLSIRRGFSARAGVNPSNGNLDLGVVYQGFDFGTSANFTQRSGNLSLSYGAKLLPFPSELSSIFDSSKDIGAAPNNPLAWYKLHSDDATAITKAISTGQDIAKAGDSTDTVGAGLRLNYTPQSGLTIYAGVLVKF